MAVAVCVLSCFARVVPSKVAPGGEGGLHVSLEIADTRWRERCMCLWGVG